MADPVRTFYDDLADSYHPIFQDWTQSIAFQAGILGPIIERGIPAGGLRILDCAGGIGTQALGLAARGHILTGADLSAPAIDRRGGKHTNGASESVLKLGTCATCRRARNPG